jgi:hypothetical protein
MPCLQLLRHRSQASHPGAHFLQSADPKHRCTQCPNGGSKCQTWEDHRNRWDSYG